MVEWDGRRVSYERRRIMPTSVIASGCSRAMQNAKRKCGATAHERNICALRRQNFDPASTALDIYRGKTCEKSF